MKMYQKYMYPIYTLTALLLSSVLLCTGCDQEEAPASEQPVSENSSTKSSGDTEKNPSRPSNSGKPTPSRPSGSTWHNKTGQGGGRKPFTEKQKQQQGLAAGATTLFKKKQQKESMLIAAMKEMVLGNYTDETIKAEMAALQGAEDTQGVIRKLFNKASEKALSETDQGKYYKAVLQISRAFLQEKGGDYGEATTAVDNLPDLAAAYDRVKKK